MADDDKYEIRTPSGRTVGTVERIRPSSSPNEIANLFFAVPIFGMAAFAVRYLWVVMPGLGLGEIVFLGFIVSTALAFFVRYGGRMGIAVVILGYVCVALLAFEVSNKPL